LRIGYSGEYLVLGDELKREWRKLHNEVNDLYSSPNIVWVIILRRVRWAGHLTYMGGEDSCIQGYGGET
jgi:hypothetical protein